METALIGGRFRLHRLLGSGAMGQVWLATDERLQRSVAVKIVLPDAADAQLGLRLEREARAAAAIQHTNVVRVFDYLEDAGRTLIVMENVEGETLADRLERDGALSIEDSLDLAAQICDGLSAAHRTGLVHRDLKPSNVMVTDDGLAKVLDFGIAKRTGRGEKNLTMTGAVIGTPRYMAPEQLNGEELDARVDIHAAGLLLYEMLAGRPAFDRENFAELMYQVVSGSADITPLEARGVPPDVIGILSRALAKHRDDRWLDAKSMSAALRVCLFGDVIHARKTPTTAGLRGIIDSGERLLQATPASLTGVPSNPGSISGLVTPHAPMQPVPGAPIARTEVIAPVRPESSRWPLIVVPALVLAVVAGVVFTRMQTEVAAGPGTTGGQTSAAGAPIVPVTSAAPEPAASVSSTPQAGPGTVTGSVTPLPDTRPAPAKPAASDVNPSNDAARAVEAKGTESVRRALAGAVEATWRFYLKDVSKEFGDDIGDLRAEFDVVVDQAGQFSSLRPARLSEESMFNESASNAVQNAAPISVGMAKRNGGWSMRVRFNGKTVRVQVR